MNPGLELSQNTNLATGEDPVSAPQRLRPGNQRKQRDVDDPERDFEPFRPELLARRPGTKTIALRRGECVYAQADTVLGLHCISDKDRSSVSLNTQNLRRC